MSLENFKSYLPIDDEKYSYKKDRLLQNKRHFNDRLGIPNE